MRKRQERESKVFSTILILLVSIIAGLLIFSNWKIAKKRKELTAKIKNLKATIEVLEERNKKLKEGISKTEKESFWEAKIREQGYQKPGETVVVIKKESQGQESEVASKNLWGKFLEEIKGILK